MPAPLVELATLDEEMPVEDAALELEAVDDAPLVPLAAEEVAAPVVARPVLEPAALVEAVALAAVLDAATLDVDPALAEFVPEPPAQPTNANTNPHLRTENMTPPPLNRRRLQTKLSPAKGIRPKVLPLLHFVTRGAQASRLFAAVLSLAGIVAFGWLGIDSYRDWQRFPTAPRPESLASALAAPLDHYALVELTDAVWDCAASKTFRRNVAPKDEGILFLVPVRSSAGRLLLEYSDPQDCAALSRTRPRGVVLAASEPLRATMRAEGFTPTDRWLCPYCGPENSKTGVVVCSSLFAASLALFPLTELIRRRRRV